MKKRALPLALLGLLGCGSPSPQPVASPVPTPAPTPSASPAPSASTEEAPKLRLPSDTRPLAETLVLAIDPKQDRFSGVADISIALDQPRRVIWLHGQGFHVSRATANAEGGAELTATWQQHDDHGTSSLTLPQALPAGKARLHIEYDVPFSPKGDGLYKITQAGNPYAFTQFENINARLAFPCFDEPGFKIPFDTTLVVPADAQAIANTREIDRKTEGTAVRVHFAPTLPLPSYLLAFAVGPFDIVAAPDSPPNAVRKRPLSIRGIATKGRGKELGYALAHTGEILTDLEQYVGLEYPYDKLDIIAVPEKGNAMENAGAVTFADQLVLMDEKTATLRQKRQYATVMTHELSHQWVGDLVTAAWWDDIWLNEAMATWLEAKVTDIWDPKIEARLGLLDSVQQAMGTDAQVSARSIRQPIASTDDIENAFDGITYSKGGAVLSMFERWVGPAVFQRGLHDYLVAHAFGSGTADDFLNAESAAAGKDMKTPFHTFLDQPGVPFVEAEVKCDAGAARLHLKQSRYLPMGSAGDAAKTWQIPVCARYQVGKDTKEGCTLLTDREGDLPLGSTCPDWVFPNSDAAAYLRFSLAPADLVKLRKGGLAKLSERERVAYANSLRAGFRRGALPVKDVLEAALPLATDPSPDIAVQPMGFLRDVRDWLFQEPIRASIESLGRDLFHAEYEKLGWDKAKGDDAHRVRLRERVISFLAETARDPAVRAEAKKRGLAFLGYGKGRDGAIHPEALDANLLREVMPVVGEEADRALWDAVRAQLAKTEDTVLRARLLDALVASRKPELVPQILALSFDPAIRDSEVTDPIFALMRKPDTRDATWQWVKANFDKLLAVFPHHHGTTELISLADDFCDDDHAKDVATFFDQARVAKIEGGPRVLASTLESIHLCATLRQADEPSARAFFSTHAKR